MAAPGTPSRFADESNAEAGPSTPRSYRTPPETPTKSGGSKRRSWFGFGGFGLTTPTKERTDSRRSSLDFGLELNDRRQSEAPVSKQLAADTDTTEELTIDARPADSPRRSSRRSRLSVDAVDDGEVMVLRNISKRSNSSERRRQSKERTRSSMDTGGAEASRHLHFDLMSLMKQVSPEQTILLRGPLSPDTTEDPAERPALTPRTSSLSAALITPRASLEKSTPPLPIDRPLPSLPPDPGNNTPPSTAHTLEASTGSTITLMPPPSNIIITPSSPRKLQKAPSRRPSTHFDDTLGRKRMIDTGTSGLEADDSHSGSQSRSSSRSRKTISRKSSLIGLGIPRSLRKNSHGDDEPPPVPAKPISVSSPHPSRPTSPAPNITFLETDPEPRGRSTEAGPGQVEQRLKNKRSRTLSGVFSRSSEPLTVPGQAIPGDTSSEQSGGSKRDQEDSSPVPVPLEPHSANSGRMSNVLSWFGMKKSSRRRNTVSKQDTVEQNTEAETKQAVQAAEQDSTPLPAAPTPAVAMTAPTRSGRPPRQRGLTVSTNNSPHESPAPRAIALPSSAPIAVPLRPTQSFGSSSTSSIPMGPPSIVSGRSSWVASPAAEEEEIIFSPPSAPWVDSPSISSPVSGNASPVSVMPEILEGVPSVPSMPPPSSTTGLPKGGSASSGNIAGLPAESQLHRDARIRAYSDAPHPSPSLAPPAPTTSLESPGRPTLGPRSNSGNSAIIDRMKGVFAKSTSARNRSRSRSLLPHDDGHGQEHVDEFGGISFKSSRTHTGRPSTASSARSTRSHRAPNATLLDLHGADKRIFLDESPGRSARNSFSGSGQTQSSAQTTATAPAQIDVQHHAHSQPQSAGAVTAHGRGSMDAALPASALAPASKTRTRASTVSFSATSPPSAFAPPSPMFKALGATPPRRRPSAISRISGGRLRSTPSSPKGGSLFPLPPRSSGGSSFPALSADEGHSASGQSILLSPGTSPRPSTTSVTGKNDNLLKQVSKVEDGQTVADWLDKVQQLVGSGDIAGVLASSGDDFHAEALRMYMAHFDFTHLALDVALRTLLLKMNLPKETQQIDRVIEAFSQRYEACEPGLFGSKDNTYILAFSMMMLHTDAFNKHNKNKMTKADYVRNTQLEGVSSAVLEAFYDNITFTPFVYQDDDDPLLTPGTAPAMSCGNGGRSRSGSDTGSIGYPFPATPASGSSMGYGSASAGSIGTNGFSLSQTPRTAAISLGGMRTDVYSLMAKDGLAALRVDVESQVPPTSPFSCLGTKQSFDADHLHERFLSAGILRIDASPSKRKVGRRKGGEEETVIRVTKVGILSRRDDPSEHGRKSTRKSKSWSVILTGTQLLFFKDPFWAARLVEHIQNTKRNDRGHLVLPAMGNFVPDEVFPLKDAVAVHDNEVDMPNTFRFHLTHRQYLMTTSSEVEMNDWVSLINYAASFKTAGIRMRGGQLEREQAVLAGAAAASSFKREIVNTTVATPPRKAVFGKSDPSITSTDGAIDGTTRTARPNPAKGDDGMPTLESVSAPGDIAALASVTPIRAKLPGPNLDATVQTKSGRINPEVDAGEPIVKDDGERLEEVFDVVKAELASGGSQVARQVTAAVTGANVATVKAHHGHERQGSSGSARRRHAGRAAEVQNHIMQLRDRLTEAETQLSAHIDQARNLAILTPFQRTTRDKIASAIPALAARVRADRLQIARYSIYLSVLSRDHERDERDFARIRHVAIQAATKSLSDPKGVKGLLDEENVQERPVPKLTLPAYDEDSRTPSFQQGLEADSAQDVPLPRTRSPSPHGLFGVSGDEHDGYASDVHSVFGQSGGKELPVLFRKGSEDDAKTTGEIRGDGDASTSRFARPTFGRTTSANSVASSTGSFLGSTLRGGSGQATDTRKLGSNLLAPPAAI